MIFLHHLGTARGRPWTPQAKFSLAKCLHFCIPPLLEAVQSRCTQSGLVPQHTRPLACVWARQYSPRDAWKSSSGSPAADPRGRCPASHSSGLHAAPRWAPAWILRRRAPPCLGRADALSCRPIRLNRAASARCCLPAAAPALPLTTPCTAGSHAAHTTCRKAAPAPARSPRRLRQLWRPGRAPVEHD